MIIIMTYKIELFAKIVDHLQPLPVFTKSPILDIGQVF